MDEKTKEPDVCAGCPRFGAMQEDVKAVAFKQKARDMSLPCWTGCMGYNREVKV